MLCPNVLPSHSSPGAGLIISEMCFSDVVHTGVLVLFQAARYVCVDDVSLPTVCFM